MAHRSHGSRFASRDKLSKAPRKRGLSPITRAMQTFEVGEKANIVIDPSIHAGMPHHRFHGLTGEVVRMQGNAVVLSIYDGNKPKLLIVRPEHLMKNRK